MKLKKNNVAEATAILKGRMHNYTTASITMKMEKNDVAVTTAISVKKHAEAEQ